MTIWRVLRNGYLSYKYPKPLSLVSIGNDQTIIVPVIRNGNIFSIFYNGALRTLRDHGAIDGVADLEWWPFCPHNALRKQIDGLINIVYERSPSSA